METVATLIVLASVIAALFGLVNLIKPLGLLRIRRRRYAAAVLGGSILAFFGGALLGAASQPGGLNAGIERAEKEREARAGAATATAAAPAAKKQVSDQLTQAEYEAYINGVQSALRPCDTAVSAAVDGIKGGDSYAAYPLVSRAEDLCLSTSSNVSAVKIPRSAKGETKKAFQDAREACEFVGTAKWAAMREAAKVLDGDNRPSAVSKAKADLEAMNPATTRCVMTIALIGVQAGLKLPDQE